MLNNQWKRGQDYPDLRNVPAQILAHHGIKPMAAVMDQGIGSEILLLITEPDGQAGQFKDIDITRFMLKAGLVNTSYGPVCFLLFYFPDPHSGNQVTYENTLNPKDAQQLSIYEKLASQAYWHVVIASDQGEVMNFFEFPNNYGLQETLDEVRRVCHDREVTDFMAAKTEFERKYSVDQLLSM